MLKTVSTLVKQNGTNAHKRLTIPAMARRRPPPQTPFGAWLVAWLDDHPDVTVEAFGERVGVSASAVSLWTTKTKRIKVEHLHKIAEVTGEPFENLQRMVYGGRTPFGEAGEGSVLPPSLMRAIELAVDRAVRQTVDELRQAGWRPPEPNAATDGPPAQ